MAFLVNAMAWYMSIGGQRGPTVRLRSVAPSTAFTLFRRWSAILTFTSEKPYATPRTLVHALWRDPLRLHYLPKIDGFCSRRARPL